MGRAEADIVGIAQNVVKALPPDISPPMVMRLAPSSIPVAMLQISSDNMTPAELYNLAYMRIRPLLVTVPGIVLPHPYGGQDMQVMVNLDQQKLLARHLTPSDIHDVLMKQYLVLPAGDIKIKQTDWIVLTNASPLKIEHFSDIPIKREGNAFVYLRDVATVQLMGRVQQNAVLVKGKQTVIIVAMKSTEASTLDVVDGIKKMIPRAEQISPEGVKIRLLDDASTFVKDSISDVLHEMLIAGALVGLIVLLLLGSWRATVIVWTSIPLSILTAIIGLHWLDETINVMTLGGLALAVGILVDDATVMIENIDRHIEMGKPLEQAIIDAANQIVVPTLVATLCIAIVWFPLFELGGVAGYLFKPMAEAVIIAMLASFILSRTLVPTMAKYMMKESPCRSRMTTARTARRGTIAERLRPLSEGVRAPLQSVPRALWCAARTGDRPSQRLRHHLSGHRDWLPVPLFLPRARLFPRDQVGGHSDAYAGAARDAHRGVRTHCHACLQQHRGVAARSGRKHRQ